MYQNKVKDLRCEDDTRTVNAPLTGVVLLAGRTKVPTTHVLATFVEMSNERTVRAKQPSAVSG